MYTIHNTNDLRLAYEHMRFIKAFIKGYPSVDKTKTNQLLMETKQAIRTYNKKSSDRHIVKDNGIDGFIEIIRFPKSITMENAQKYFDENERITCKPSAYDCTGQPFTLWNKICERQGRVICYHEIAYDV